MVDADDEALFVVPGYGEPLFDLFSLNLVREAPRAGGGQAFVRATRVQGQAGMTGSLAASRRVDSFAYIDPPAN